MKKKAIAFIAILMILSSSLAGITVFAYSFYYEYTNTSETFNYTKSTSVMKIRLDNGLVQLTMSDSNYNSNYKYLNSISYTYDTSQKDYIESVNYFSTSNSSSMMNTFRTSGIALIRGVGAVYNSQYSESGIMQMLVVNSKKYSDYPTPERYI